jgi:uncharacterized sporulation protein YeaH/YhbH (DUF444 family)
MEATKCLKPPDSGYDFGDRASVTLDRAYHYTVTGSPANLSIRRTMRNSMARRISLKRPKHAAATDFWTAG